jgi:hypothetical protein
MVGASCKVTTPAGLFIVALGLSPAHAQSFVDAPISCGQNSMFTNCTAAFDGWTLRISHNRPDGKNSVAVYRRCFVDPVGIHCAVGEWQSASGNGPLGGRRIGLRNGMPFPD